MAYHKQEESRGTGTGVLNVVLIVIFLGVVGLFCSAAPEVVGALLMIIVPILLGIFILEKGIALIFKIMFGGEGDCRK